MTGGIVAVFCAVGSFVANISDRHRLFNVNFFLFFPRNVTLLSFQTIVKPPHIRNFWAARYSVVCLIRRGFSLEIADVGLL
jgi:hypothetical protein